MATLHTIAFFLAWVFLLQEIQAQSSKSFEYKEEYDKSSSSHEDNESFKKEVKELEEQAGSIMAEICQPRRLLGMTCEVSDIGRRFQGSIFNSLKRFVHMPVRILHGVVYVCGKIAKCIGKTILSIPKKIIESLPSCLRGAFYKITDFLKDVLNKISEVLKTVFSFVKEVASCTLRLIGCAKDIFKQIFSTIIRILKNVIMTATNIARRIFDLAKDPNCPALNAAKDPAVVIMQCGQCVFCSFKPGTSICNNQ